MDNSHSEHDMGHEMKKKHDGHDHHHRLLIIRGVSGFV